MTLRHSVKTDLFQRLEDLLHQLLLTKTHDTESGKKILYEVDEIISHFNKGKQKDAPKNLDLNSDELGRLRSLVDNIWLEASKRNIEVWPKPDIVVKVG